VIKNNSNVFQLSTLHYVKKVLTITNSDSAFVYATCTQIHLPV